MQKFILIMALLLGLGACSDSSKKNETNGRDDLNNELTNVTDYSDCGEVSNQTTPEGTWVLSQEQGGIRFDLLMTIELTGVSVTNICRASGRELSATAYSTSSYTTSTFSVYNESSEQQKIEEPDFKLDCSVSLSRETVNYSFKGRCLVLSKPGEESVTLAPADENRFSLL